MTLTQEVARVQSAFFGLSYREICDAIVRVNNVFNKTIDSRSPHGKAIIELQGIAQDLADYADLMRQHESKITPIIDEAVARTEEKRARNPRLPRRAPDKKR